MIEYPLLARKRGIEGDIMVNVTINRLGELKKVKIVKSSGYTVLDDYTVNLAGKIKFDVSPPHTIELPLKISYRLNR
jgi:protein TonB